MPRIVGEMLQHRLTTKQTPPDGIHSIHFHLTFHVAFGYTISSIVSILLLPPKETRMHHPPLCCCFENYFLVKQRNSISKEMLHLPRFPLRFIEIISSSRLSTISPIFLAGLICQNGSIRVVQYSKSMTAKRTLPCNYCPP